MRAAVTAVAKVERFNQAIAASEPDSGETNGTANLDTESAFTTEVCDTSNIHTNMGSVCCNIDVTTGPTQLEEANLTYISKVQAIQNLHYCVGHISPERLQHLVENGQWSWTHAFKPANFARELPPYPFCALAKAKRFSFTKPITIADQMGGLFFIDVQGGVIGGKRVQDRYH